MSEIKGQLLGVLLVVSLFGTISGLMTTLIKNTSSDISDKVNSEITQVEKTNYEIADHLNINI